jgi:hypothetical protein
VFAMPRTSLRLHGFDNLLAEAGLLRNFSAGAGIQELRNLSILVAQDGLPVCAQVSLSVTFIDEGWSMIVLDVVCNS